MAGRLLVMGAGGGASNNLIRSLGAGGRDFVIIGCHADRFILKKSPADRNYLIRDPDHPGFFSSLRAVIRRERVDLLIPNSDQDVRLVSSRRAQIPCRLFLPAHAVIERCQDKYALSTFLRAHGVPAPLTYPLGGRATIDAAFRRLGRRRRLWCRLRTGSGSRGAIPVTRPAQVRSWIAYWHEMWRIPTGSFTLSEYLPGRDFAVQGIWQRGTCVLLKMCERLSYFGGGSQPSGVSSTPALGKLVSDPRVVRVCLAAIRALAPTASGVFSIDLKENADGVPCVTEINAGRFCMITSIFDSTGKHNMAASYARLGLGEPVEISDPLDPSESYYLVRDLDTLPGIFHADELFEEIHDAEG